MADLLEVAGQTLRDMTDLASRAGEVRQAVHALTEGARAETRVLYEDEVKFSSRFDQFGQRLVALDTRLGEAAEQAAARIDTQNAQVAAQRQELQASQAQLRQRLTDLRGQAAQLTGQAATIEEKTEKALLRFKEETAELLNKSVARLDAVEEKLRAVTDQRVKAVERAIQDRRKDFKSLVDSELTPRIEKDVKQFSERMAALSVKLNAMASELSKKCRLSSDQRLREMKVASSTDWYGGGNASGECNAALRVKEMQRLGGQKGGEVEHYATSLLGAANGFQATVRDSVVPLYKKVYALPDRVKGVCNKVTG